MDSGKPEIVASGDVVVIVAQYGTKNAVFSDVGGRADKSLFGNMTIGAPEGCFRDMRKSEDLNRGDGFRRRNPRHRTGPHPPVQLTL